MSSRPPNASILAQIEQKGIRAPRVALHDPDAAPESGVLRRTGRYEIIGEIASGGVGTVMRARDIDLGRDVAIKVLHERHLKNPDLVQRLIEEAQIGGQLQHPAIVPVYEIGLDDKNVPFIAMKLVKGETLAAILAERKDPHDKRRKYLQRFLQACRAMAYAHSRGVVHRDLKPSNLMVGAYGDLMILDWGFAKVLQRGGIADEMRASLYRDDVTRIQTVRSSDAGQETVQGALMGTPAYMPPEQALGQVDDLDTRSDVFSLGAILCEILTGEPPYGTDPNEIISRAARGDVADAFRRLEICGADQELVDTAKACLAPIRKERPKNAQALADAIANHLEAAEKRTEQMEMVAIKQREAAAKAKADALAQRAGAEAVRTQVAEDRARTEAARDEARKARDTAAQNRKAHRQRMLIGTALTAVLVLGGGGLLVNSKLEAKRVRKARDVVEAGVNSAQAFRAAGKNREAFVAAQQAVDAGQPGAESEALARAQTLLETLESEQTATRAAEAKREKERFFLARLDRCRARRSDLYEPSVTDRWYRDAFTGHGIDLGQGASTAASAVNGCLNPQAVIAALDDWAWLRRVKLKAGDWNLPLEVARSADQDAWRNQVRGAAGQLSARSVTSMTAKHPAKLPADSARLLGLALGMVGRGEEAVEYLGQAQLVHAGDPWILSLLVDYQTNDKGSGAAVTRYAAAAATLRPTMAEFRLDLAYAEGRMKDWTAALTDCAAARKLDPKLAGAHGLHAQLLEWSGEPDKALSVWKQAIKLDPNSTWVRMRYGMALLFQGDVAGALRECDAAVELRPGSGEIRLAKAKAAYATGDAAQARANCQSALQAGYRTADVYRTLAMTFLRARHTVKARENIDEALKLAPNDPFVRNALGLICWREEKHADAQEAFTQATGAQGAPKATAWANLGALALERGDSHAAVNACREAVDAADKIAHGPWGDGFTSSGKSPLDQSIDVLRAVVKRNPIYAYGQHRLGVALEKKGQYMDAIRACKEALGLRANYAHCVQTLIWIYTTCPLVTYRNTPQALDLAKRLSRLTSLPSAARRQMLGIARYRAEDFEAAADSLERSNASQGGGDAWNWYFLSMARWRLGNEKTARRWLAKANAWTEANAPKDEKLARFRKEAEALIPAAR